jgi:hypothetical protein
MRFRVGMKVVCVRSPISATWAGMHGCEVGKTYTVREVRRAFDDSDDAILVEGIVNPIYNDGEECGFYARRFRPVVERKTSIEIFRPCSIPQSRRLKRAPQFWNHERPEAIQSGLISIRPGTSQTTAIHLAATRWEHEHVIEACSSGWMPSARDG